MKVLLIKIIFSFVVRQMFCLYCICILFTRILSVPTHMYAQGYASPCTICIWTCICVLFAAISRVFINSVDATINRESCRFDSLGGRDRAWLGGAPMIDLCTQRPLSVCLVCFPAAPVTQLPVAAETLAK